jgi:hypothetical protein
VNRNRYATIGAGPDSWLNIFGDMIAAFNRPSDVSGPQNSRMHVPIAPKYSTEDLAIAALLALVDNYNDGPVSYTLLPQYANEYNSNSFISGILNAAGLVLPGQPGGLPYGFDTPVPLMYFFRP